MDDQAGPGEGGTADPATAHDATFVLSCPDDEHADRVRAAVAREVGAIDDDRSRARLTGDGTTVTVSVEARHVSALRAATGTWLGLLEAADETVHVADRVRRGEDGATGTDLAGDDT